MRFEGRELRSIVGEDGTLRLTLEHVVVDKSADDEVVVRVEAAPINPSDLGLLLGPADVATLRSSGTAHRPELIFDIAEGRMASVKARLGQSLAVGKESTGTVVAAGASARALDGKCVGMLGGAMYADYRRLKVRGVVVLPDRARAADGASMFVNRGTRCLHFVASS